MKSDKQKDKPVKQPQPYSNLNRVKAIFAAAETELRKHFETKKA